jgi:hypothetical protein
VRAFVSGLAADHQLALVLGNAAHPLDGIDDQVQHHLLQLHPITMNARQARRELREYRDAALDGFAVGQRAHL